MGSNKRYARQVDARMDASIVERIMVSSAPESLSDEELELSRFDLTKQETHALSGRGFDTQTAPSK